MRWASASSPTSSQVARALLKSFIFPYYLASLRVARHRWIDLPTVAADPCNPPPVRLKPVLKRWLISLTGSSDSHCKRA